MERFLKFFRLVKVDEATRMVYGLITAEREDKDGETCHYASTVPEYRKVNEEMAKMSDGDNIMPLREMHQLHAVGAGKSISFDDQKKEIRMAFKVVEESTWKKVLEKVLLGFSQGGKYLKQWTEAGVRYYTAEPGEVSLVDNPCLAGAQIEYVKASGQSETYIVPESRLSEAEVDRIVKAFVASISGFDTRLKEFSDKIANLNVQQSTEGETMNKEQIKKCAAALGISEEEFVKTYVEGDALAKGEKGLAALHAHLKKAVAHHEKMVGHHDKMVEMHKAHSEMHAQHAEHLQNCVKAYAACMDGAQADKVLKALGIEVKEEKKETVETTNKELAAVIAKAVEAATEKLQKEIKDLNEKMEKTVAPIGQHGTVHLALVDREGKVIEKASAAAAGADPMPVS